MKPVNTTASAATDKMAAFVRIWVAQFGNTPHDWARRNDSGSSYYLFADFVNDERTNLRTAEIALEKFEEPPPFKRFKSAYFSTLGVAGNGNETVCGRCGNVRWLYAVQAYGNTKAGGRGQVITGPGHRVLPLEQPDVVMVRCTCNPGRDEKSGNYRFATSDRDAAERHANECHAAWKRGEVAEVIDDSRIPAGDTGEVEI